MASCPECNNEISEGAQVCIHCGARFNSDDASSANGSANNAIAKGMDNGPAPNNDPGSSPTSAVKKPGGGMKISPKNMRSTMKPQMKGKTGNTGSNMNVNDPNPGENSKPNTTPPGNSNAGTTAGNPGGNSSGDTSSRSKWLQEQDKIKQELEALKGKISTGFSLDNSLDLQGEEEIFKLEDDEMQTIKDASISLTPLKRPLTEEEEEKKEELLVEIKDLKAEGYDTTRLERIVEVDPTSAWQEFVQYMDDIDTLAKLRKRYSELDTTGFENESESIKNNLDNPDMIHQIERELDALEKNISMGTTEEDQGGLRELIEAGKEAFKSNEYQKALNFYKSALKIDPNNREVEFYRKKTEAKLQAFSTLEEEPAPAYQAPPMQSFDEVPAAPPIPPPAPAPAPPAPRPAAGPATQRKVKVKPKTGVPGMRPKGQKVMPKVRSQIPTGANAEVKTPLSVSMTPKLPANRGAPRPVGAQKAPMVKPKRMAMKRPLPTATPRPVQARAPAPAPAPAPASSNPAEVEALGFNAFINKDFEKALGYYEQVLALDPNFPGAIAQRDKCLEELGRK